MYVPNYIRTKSTAELNEQIKKELQIPDPQKTIGEILESGTPQNNSKGGGIHSS